MGLDLAYNKICKIDDTLENLVRLPKLKMLSTFGNPIALIKDYKQFILSQLKNLKFFDHEEIVVKEKKKKDEKNNLNSQATALNLIDSLHMDLTTQDVLYIKILIKYDIKGICLQLFHSDS